MLEQQNNNYNYQLYQIYQGTNLKELDELENQLIKKRQGHHHPDQQPQHNKEEDQDLENLILLDHDQKPLYIRQELKIQISKIEQSMLEFNNIEKKM